MKTNPALPKTGKLTSRSLHALVGRHVIHNSKGFIIDGGRIIKTSDLRDVVLMALAGNYAMVRRPHCMPYVATIAEIEMPPNSVLGDSRKE